jgi:hypothetical protein
LWWWFFNIWKIAMCVFSPQNFGHYFRQKGVTKLVVVSNLIGWFVPLVIAFALLFTENIAGNIIGHACFIKRDPSWVFFGPLCFGVAVGIPMLLASMYRIYTVG